MNPTEQLRAICAAIFGPEWISPLSRCLGVGIRTAQRWASGRVSTPAWVFSSPELIGAATAANKELGRRLERVQKYLASAP